MKEALKEAQKAFDANEVPIGAVVVFNKRILARAYNQTEMLKDATAHAEMLAITAAMNAIGAKYLKGCSLYVTVEPCNMCAGALYWSQISSVIYGASDEKRGYSHNNKDLLHPKTVVIGNILTEECGVIVSEFFKRKRNED